MDPDRIKRPRLPVWLAKTLLALSVVPFLFFGTFLVTRILRVNNGGKLTIPFIIFVALFCAAPLIQVISSWRKLNRASVAENKIAPPPVEISNPPAGREFYFPAARKPGRLFIVAALALFWAAIIWGLFYTKAPWMAPMVVSLLGVGLFFGLLNLWFKDIRLIVGSQKVTLAKRWFFLNDTASFDNAHVIRFDSRPRSGRDFHDIQIVLQGDNKIGIARGIIGKAEVDRIVREMNDALGRRI